MYGLLLLDNIWKSGFWECKKIYILRKSKVVQMKFLAMHITNQKFSFDIYSKKCTKYIHGTWSLLNILMIFFLTHCYKYTPANKTGFVLQGH